MNIEEHSTKISEIDWPSLLKTLEHNMRGVDSALCSKIDSSEMITVFSYKISEMNPETKLYTATEELQKSIAIFSKTISVNQAKCWKPFDEPLEYYIARFEPITSVQINENLTPYSRLELNDEIKKYLLK